MPNVDHLRKAAISVYFLNKNDQQWVMSKLLAEEKLKLSGYLDELHAMAIPRDQITKKTILSYLDIPLDDDLFGLMTEILAKEPGLLVDYINKEPAWLGNYLMKEYPSLFDGIFKSKLSRHKLNEIIELPIHREQGLTDRTRRAVFKSVQHDLMKKYLSNNTDINAFSGFIDRYELASQELA